MSARPDRHDGDCGDCPLSAATRRRFLRDVGLAVVATLAGTTVAPGRALAELVSTVSPSRANGGRLSYPLPTTDAISLDEANDVILARWRNRVYAFSLRCPHRGARLEWRANESRIYCPKHKARFAPDGSHASGRRTRHLDRYDVARSGESVVVDLGVVRRVDEDPAAWGAAVIAVG